MNTKFSRIGVVSRIDLEDALKLAREIIKYLEKKGLEVVQADDLAEKTRLKGKNSPINEMKVDLIVVIGGDGTILRTCLFLPKPEPPILTINMGERGFLAEAKPEEAIDAINKCLKNDFRLEEHSKLTAYVNHRELPEALNEVFITTGIPVKLLYAKVWKDGDYVGECQADGVIVASQVGSTGYSLSAGGPVIDSEMEAFVVTAVCPLTPFRPIVFPKSSTITVEVRRPKRVSVIIDGHHQEVLEDDKPKITVKVSDNKTRFVRFKENFYQRLRSRLLYPGGAC